MILTEEIFENAPSDGVIVSAGKTLKDSKQQAVSHGFSGCTVSSKMIHMNDINYTID